MILGKSLKCLNACFVAQYKDNGTFLHFHRSVLFFYDEKSPHKHYLAYDPPVTIYMGRDKVESSYYPTFYHFFWLTGVSDEDLIKYAWPQDIWFHVDKLSSAHVYLRLPESISSWEAIPEPLLVDCAQLVKANSIEGDTNRFWFPFKLRTRVFLGNKRNDLTVIYTPADNLKVSMRLHMLKYATDVRALHEENGRYGCRTGVFS